MRTFPSYSIDAPTAPAKTCPDDQRPRNIIGHGVGMKTGAVETGGKGCGVADHERKVGYPFGGVLRVVLRPVRFFGRLVVGIT